MLDLPGARRSGDLGTERRTCSDASAGDRAPGRIEGDAHRAPRARVARASSKRLSRQPQNQRACLVRWLRCVGTCWVLFGERHPCPSGATLNLKGLRRAWRTRLGQVRHAPPSTHGREPWPPRASARGEFLTYYSHESGTRIQDARGLGEQPEIGGPSARHKAQGRLHEARRDEEDPDRPEPLAVIGMLGSMRVF